MTTNTVKGIENWYGRMCDGDWEHTYGIQIDTLDNPGWVVRIDLAGTPLQEKRFDAVNTDRSNNNWLRCEVSDMTFTGLGGPGNLQEILEIFLAWESAVA